MVTLELKFIGKVQIQDSQVVEGPEFLKPTINVLKQKFNGSSEEGDQDYRIAENLVKMMGGKILEHVPDDMPPSKAS